MARGKAIDSHHPGAGFRRRREGPPPSSRSFARDRSGEDEHKTRGQLLSELRGLRRQVAALLEEQEALEQRDRARRERRQRYRELALHAADVLMEIGARGRILYSSPNCIDLLGVAPESFVGRSIVDPELLRGLHPRDRIRMLEKFPLFVSGERPSGFAFRWRHPDGRTRCLEARANTFRTLAGELHVVVTYRDVTGLERGRAERCGARPSGD